MDGVSYDYVYFDNDRFCIDGAGSAVWPIFFLLVLRYPLPSKGLIDSFFLGGICYALHFA